MKCWPITSRSAAYAHGRREKARVHRIGIGAPNRLNLCHVMDRHHARIAGVKLAFQAVRPQVLKDRIGARSNDQHRPFFPLGNWEQFYLSRRPIAVAVAAACLAKLWLKMVEGRALSVLPTWLRALPLSTVRLCSADDRPSGIPFVLLPASLVPVVLFCHLVVFRKLSSSTQG